MKCVKSPFYVAAAVQSKAQFIAESAAKTLPAFLQAKPDSDRVALAYLVASLGYADENAAAAACVANGYAVVDI